MRPSENSLYHHPRGCGSLRLWGAESPNEAIQPPLSTCPLPHPFIWTPDNVPAPTPHISRSFHFKRLRLQFLQLLFLLKLFCLQHTTKNSPLCWSGLQPSAERWSVISKPKFYSLCIRLFPRLNMFQSERYDGKSSSQKSKFVEPSTNIWSSPSLHWFLSPTKWFIKVVKCGTKEPGPYQAMKS